MAKLSKAEEQKRVRELVLRKHGVKCPEMDYAISEGFSVLVEYWCKEGDPPRELRLDEEEAQYIGLDRGVRDRPETRGY